MAWFEKKDTGIYQISFRFGGQRYKKALRQKVKPKQKRSKQEMKNAYSLLKKED